VDLEKDSGGQFERKRERKVGGVLSSLPTESHYIGQLTACHPSRVTTVPDDHPGLV